MPFEKQTSFVAPDLLCAAFFSWCYVLPATANWHIKATAANELNYTAHWHVIDIHTNNGTRVPQLLFKVKAKSQGYFLTAMPNVLHKTNSLPADLAVLKFKTSILSALQLHKCFVQPNWIKWFIWVLQGCNNLLCLRVAQHEGIQISSKPSSPATTGPFSQYLNLTGSSNQLTFPQKKAF